MKVKDAKAIARDWVKENRKDIPGYCGAIFAGSVNWYSNQLAWPVGSDVDIFLYQINPTEQIPQRKIMHKGVVLEVSYHDFEEIHDPYEVLRMPYIAPQFSRNGSLHDPYRLLAQVYAVVGKHFKEEQWVRARIARVYRKAKWRYQRVIDSQSHDLLRFNPEFMGGIHNTATILAVPTFLNLTLRKSFVYAGQVLAKHGSQEMQEELLGILGSQDFSVQDARKHLRVCRPMFDRAVAVHKTPFWGCFEMDMSLKKKLFGGITEMIDDGYHREAVFYMLYLHLCCQSSIRRDGTEKDKALYHPLFAGLMADLGITDPEAYKARARRGLRTLNKFHKKAKELVVK